MVGMNFNLVPGGKYIDNQSEKISTLGNTIDVAYGTSVLRKRACIVSNDQLHTFTEEWEVYLACEIWLSRTG